MSIKVTSVSKIYKTQKALDNVSFSANKGEVIGFLGPNGAGKSTMMKILTGFIKPNAGEVFVDEIDVLQNPLEAQKIIGYLPEHNPLYTDMYVREYLQFLATIFKVMPVSSCLHLVCVFVLSSPRLVFVLAHVCLLLPLFLLAFACCCLCFACACLLLHLLLLAFACVCLYVPLCSSDFAYVLPCVRLLLLLFSLGFIHVFA